MLTWRRPGQSRSTASWASRKSWLRPGFTVKRTALNAVMALPPRFRWTRRNTPPRRPMKLVAALQIFLRVRVGVDHRPRGVILPPFLDLLLFVRRERSLPVGLRLKAVHRVAHRLAAFDLVGELL